MQSNNRNVSRNYYNQWNYYNWNYYQLLPVKLLPVKFRIPVCRSRILSSGLRILNRGIRILISGFRIISSRFRIPTSVSRISTSKVCRFLDSTLARDTSNTEMAEKNNQSYRISTFLQLFERMQEMILDKRKYSNLLNLKQNSHKCNTRTR